MNLVFIIFLVGSYSRLVVTPLSDRCWMTISSAFKSFLAANPAGPAGTGKTECCKDFAKILARYLILFNCSPQNNIRMMEKLFIGQAFTGSWICFDEFNRIDVEVLSVVAQQMMQIRQALLENLSSIVFFGKYITINSDMSNFVTYNVGYIGRSAIPDNLLALLRPLSMIIPDYRMIAENILYSMGFLTAPILAQKIYVIFKLLSEQVTMQNHYDFGMRSIKNVLDIAGEFKRKDQK